MLVSIVGDGFMPTSIEPAVAFQALSFIRSGGSFLPPSALSTSLREATMNGVAPVSDLTARQEEVFGRLCKGLSNKAIARQLDMSEATVKVHARHIMRKFGVANRTQLAVAAMNQGALRVAPSGKESGEQGDDSTTQPALPAVSEAKKSRSVARSARGESAAKFLEVELRDASSVAVIEIEQRARTVGLLAQHRSISQDKAFRRARDQLGVLTYQQARRWYWQLPAQAPLVACSASDAPPIGDALPLTEVGQPLSRGRWVVVRSNHPTGKTGYPAIWVRRRARYTLGNQLFGLSTRRAVDLT